ncbi:MAG: C-terminal binding protein [Ignavibacteriales bacterium]|nr:C-terminal binding protein [Ignavibacteriales bacterium]
MKPKIVITDWGFPSLKPEEEIFASHHVEMIAYQCKTEDDVIRAAADADVVMAQWAPVKKRAIDALQHCKGIVRYGIGLDNIDLEAAKSKGIPIRNVPDYCLDEVADHTMALMLAIQRQVCSVFDLVRKSTWRITPPLALPPLRSSTLGLIGFGRIAQLVAMRAKAFKMNIVAADPYPDDSVFEKAGVRRTSLEEIFNIADIISLHCPLTDETRRVVNVSTLQQMKKTALLVNTSRGGLVDTRALEEALRKNQIAGAGLDVLEKEPIQSGDPLLTLPNIIITSHNAWYSSQSVGELQKKAAIAAIELLNSPRL